MLRWLAVGLVALGACRDHHDAGRERPVSVVSLPKLPLSDDGATELRMIGKRIEVNRDDPGQEIALLLERSGITGRLEDYQEALARSAAWVEAAPREPAAWRLRVQVLTRVHQFAAARDAFSRVAPDDAAGLATALDEATGRLDQSIPRREAAVKAYPNPVSLTMLAATLGVDGRLDQALALMPRAVATLHDNSPQLLYWILFQWGRLYEQKGELGTAREFFEAAHKRMPGSLETVTHLAQAMIATGDRAAAKRLVDAALPDNRHPELLALAAELGDAARLPQARQEWDRYLAALPEAFADHAARFYLGIGADPKRALELARANLANRDTREARALVVEAALAGGDPVGACAVVDPLVAPSALRSQRFIAWRALARCGRTAEAARLADELGIAH